MRTAPGLWVGLDGGRARAAVRRQDIQHQRPTGVNTMEHVAG